MISKRSFGKTADGREVTAYLLASKGGVQMEVLDWGGKIVKILTPDASGELKDIAIGFDNPAGWEIGDPYYGALIGRYANRIAAGKFTLDGKEYSLACNNTPAGIPCSLHGGDGGWHDRIWTAESFERGDDIGLKLSLVSPDGEGGYPGEVKVEVVYTLTADNVWRIDYSAECDRATPLSMTQHVYFNLKGEAGGTVEDHDLQVAASRFLPYDAGQIPTGELREVAGTPFDFTSPRKIGERINDDCDQLRFGKGYDHCWAVDGEGMRFAAKLSGHGRTIEVYTTEPGLQIYTGNWIPDGFAAKGGDKLCERCGIALETGHYPDSPNKAGFPTTILLPGQKLESRTEFRFISGN